MKKYDVIIIGAGPAGLTSALYTSRANLSTLILDRGLYGGQMNNTAGIENYTGFKNVLGSKLSKYMYDGAIQFGAKYTYGNVKKIVHKKHQNIITTDLGTYEAPILILATGSTNRKLGITGEQKYAGEGVSYCAVCDANFFKNQPVIVVGGGDSAFTEALYLSHIVSHVDIIIRKSHAQAEPEVVDKINHQKNIQCIYNTNVKAIHGNNKQVKYVDLYNNAKKTNSKLKTSAVFIYIGVIPNTKIIQNTPSLPICDKSGWILADDTMHVLNSKQSNQTVDGVYVVGDVRENQLQQIVTAVGSGGVAGHNAYLELENHFNVKNKNIYRR